jgi:hypothetical protein
MNRTALFWGLGGIAGLLCLSGWMLARHAPAPPDPPDPTPAERKALAVGPASQRSAALDGLASRVLRDAPTLQVHLVQRTPRGPLVIAALDPDSDDPQATHWLLPWPGVVQKLAEPVRASCLTESRYQGTAYRHRLVPLDGAGEHVLVLTIPSPPRAGTPPAAIACWVASLVALLAILGVSRTSAEA